MSPRDDYRYDMPGSKLANREIEVLLRGQMPSDPRLEELRPFVDALRAQARAQSSAELTRRLAAQSAALVRQQRDRERAVTGRSRNPRPGRRPAWIGARIATALGAIVVAVGMSSVAMAADASAPGDALYGIDRALEAIGIGDGAATERIAEADTMISDGREEEALTFLGEYLEEAATNGDDEAVDLLADHLESVVSGANANAVDSLQRVTDLRTFIEENKGEGNGVDGKQFGETISELARGRSQLDQEAPDTPIPQGDEPGTDNDPPVPAGPKPDRGNAPDNAGPGHQAGTSGAVVGTEPQAGTDGQGNGNGQDNADNGQGAGNGNGQGAGNGNAQGNGNGNGNAQGNGNGP